MRLIRYSVLGIVALALISSVFGQTTAPENLLQLELFNIRTDQALLADRILGVGERPDGWTDNEDLASESIVADLFINNELLANAFYGDGVRPAEWIGATTRNAELIARNIRHDLELIATEQLGGSLRPDEWQGSQPIYSCSRTIMNTALLLEAQYNVRPTRSEGARDYCVTVAAEIEDQLIGQAIGFPQDAENTPQQILTVRGDLERTADELFGVNQRPAGWLDNIDVNSPTLAFDIGNDLEILANTQLGLETRPDGWITTPVVSSQTVSLRNLRFNLEILTDELLGDGVRPRGWQGSGQIEQCLPTLQNLVLLADQTLNYELPQTDLTGEEYCALVETEVNNLIENPPLPDDEELAQEEIDRNFVATSELAFSYLDPAATQYMGVMPRGTEFRAWYRNFGQSTMMFVSGEDFALFIDRRFTTFEQERFNRLPTLDGVRPLTFCDAGWCNGPGPTPTPTGDGPILDIITAATPAATVGPAEEEGGDPLLEDEVIVNWNAIRVNYLLQRPDAGVAQVTLEICRDTSQVACEPVTSIVNTETGDQIPALSQFNGLNVYELPYGYSTNFTVTGTRFISNDIWLLDPSALGG